MCARTFQAKLAATLTSIKEQCIAKNVADVDEACDAEVLADLIGIFENVVDVSTSINRSAHGNTQLLPKRKRDGNTGTEQSQKLRKSTTTLPKENKPAESVRELPRPAFSKTLLKRARPSTENIASVDEDVTPNKKQCASIDTSKQLEQRRKLVVVDTPKVSLTSLRSSVSDSIASSSVVPASQIKNLVLLTAIETLSQTAVTELGYTTTSVLPHASIQRGLRNLGNTCYGNALLAVVSRLASVQRWLREHAGSHGGTSVHGRTCVLCMLAHDTDEIVRDNTLEPYTPLIMRYRGKWCERFNNNAQQDAHEAFTTLFDECNEVDLRALRACARCNALTPN